MATTAVGNGVIYAAHAKVLYGLLQRQLCFHGLDAKDLPAG
jgi:hypothetical protein